MRSTKQICRARPAEDTLGGAIHAEVAWEITTLLGRVFTERKQTGGLELEAVEMAFRAALHRARAAALTRLLQFPEPVPEQLAAVCRDSQKIVEDLAEQLDRFLAEQNKYQSLRRELLEAQRNRKSEQLSKEQLALLEVVWKAPSREAERGGATRFRKCMVKATPDVRRLNYGRPDIESGIIERGCFSETSSGKVLENERIDFAVKGNIAR